MIGCTVRIVNDAVEEATAIQSKRDCLDVYFDLARLVRQVNRRREETLRASVRLAQGMIVLHLHHPSSPDGGALAEQWQTAVPFPRWIGRRLVSIVDLRPEAAGAVMAARCRVRIVNDLNGRATVVESRRERAAVYWDLAKLIRQVNRRRDDTVRASLHLLENLVILHWHCPWIFARKYAAELLEIVEPLRQVEAIIWPHAERIEGKDGAR